MRCIAINTIHYTVPGEPGIKIALPGESFEIDEASFEGLEKSKAAIRDSDKPIVYPDTATMIAAGYRADALKNASDYGTAASDEAIAAADLADKAAADKAAEDKAAEDKAAADKAAADKAAADKAAADKAAADKAAADKAAADKSVADKSAADKAAAEDPIG
jgi:colicin import membrane protein